MHWNLITNNEWLVSSLFKTTLQFALYLTAAGRLTTDGIIPRLCVNTLCSRLFSRCFESTDPNDAECWCTGLVWNVRCDSNVNFVLPVSENYFRRPTIMYVQRSNKYSFSSLPYIRLVQINARGNSFAYIRSTYTGRFNNRCCLNICKMMEIHLAKDEIMTLSEFLATFSNTVWKTKAKIGDSFQVKLLRRSTFSCNGTTRLNFIRQQLTHCIFGDQRLRAQKLNWFCT